MQKQGPFELPTSISANGKYLSWIQGVQGHLTQPKAVIWSLDGGLHAEVLMTTATSFEPAKASPVESHV